MIDLQLKQNPPVLNRGQKKEGKSAGGSSDHRPFGLVKKLFAKIIRKLEGEK